MSEVCIVMDEAADYKGIVVHAKTFDGPQRGVIAVESNWPNSDQ